MKKLFQTKRWTKIVSWKKKETDGIFVCSIYACASKVVCLSSVILKYGVHMNLTTWKVNITLIIDSVALLIAALTPAI